jgi:hypothetical protein
LRGLFPLYRFSFRTKNNILEADIDYGQWLKSQPVGKVEDILGKGKASLFLGGKVKLSDLVRSDTREISLRELKEKFG